MLTMSYSPLFLSLKIAAIATLLVFIAGVYPPESFPGIYFPGKVF